MEHKHPYCRQIAAVQTRGWIIERVPMPNGDVLEDQAINPQKAVDRGAWIGCVIFGSSTSPQNRSLMSFPGTQHQGNRRGHVFMVLANVPQSRVFDSLRQPVEHLRGGLRSVFGGGGGLGRREVICSVPHGLSLDSNPTASPSMGV
ncbi:hypothetical protein LSTR_LSTR009606 [Laodelphax striatellus]|uniref:Uncharacterized protein n=1 Tax=Laodelphax striatellus TaxID=195883 RepID=A0A482WIS1_LAOST|nr:hypothetical protein LSTR_LSTR009606 [Laodelphax striatellus]